MGVEIKILTEDEPVQPEIEIGDLKPGFNFILLPDPKGRKKEVREGGFLSAAYEGDSPSEREILDGVVADYLEKAKNKIEHQGGQFYGVLSTPVVDESHIDINRPSIIRNFILAWKD